MKSKYIYSIAIIVVLLVILLIYNTTKGTPVSNTTNTSKSPSPSPSPGPSPGPQVTSGTGLSTINTTYNSSTVTVSVINSTIVSNTISLSATSGAPQFFGNYSHNINLTLSMGGIQYDPNGNYLNFYQDTTDTTRMAIQNPLSCGLSITDTSKNLIYNTSSASVVGNVLTVTSGTSPDTYTLAITFTDSFYYNPTPSNPISAQNPQVQIIYRPCIMQGTTIQQSGSLQPYITIGELDPIYNTIQFFSADSSYTSDLASCVQTQCKPNVVSVNYTQETATSPSYLNFITDTTSNSRYYIYNPENCFSGFSLSDTSNGQFYDMSNIVIDEYTLSFTTNGYTLKLTFPSLFTS